MAWVCRNLIMNLKFSSNIRRVLSQDIAIRYRLFSVLTVSMSPNVSVNSFTVVRMQPILSQSRNYAKGKDRVKSSAKKVEIREDMLEEQINVKKFKSEMEEALETMKEQYIQNVSLRSSSGAIEALQIEFEGEKYAIRDLAQINRKNPKVLAMNFSVFPQTIPTVIQVLNESGMNLNPQQDGTMVYLPIPKVTREHRENLAKNANTLCNKCKVALRDAQSRYLKKLEAKQDEGLSKELFLVLRDQFTQLAAQYIKKADKMREDKNKELLGEC